MCFLLNAWRTLLSEICNPLRCHAQTLIEQAFFAPLLAVALIVFDVVLRGLSPLSVLPMLLKKATARSSPAGCCGS